MKTCTICGEAQVETSFYANSATSDGLGSQCKACDALGHALRRRERKQKIVDHFGGRCTRCGYSKCVRALDFHHPNDDKEAQISTLLERAGNKKQAYEEAAKCQLLCANCHREVHDSVIVPGPYEKLWRRRVLWKPGDHGTYTAHRYCGPPKCEACKKAYSEKNKQYKAKARARKAASGVVDGKVTGVGCKPIV